MLLLSLRISSGQHRARLAEPELELTEQSLALAHAQLDSIGLVDPRRQRLAIPKIDPHPGIARFFPQHSIDFFYLPFFQAARASGPLSFGQTRQALLIEAVNPIFNRTRCVAKQASHLRARHTLRNQQNSMQSVIVARLLGPLNFLLQT